MISFVLLLMAVQPLGARKAYLVEEAGRNGAKSVPHTINYQGYLTTADNTPVDDTISMVFALYRQPDGGEALWQSSEMMVPVHNGVFNVVLGENEDIPDTVFNGGEVWLEIRINGAPLTPRQKVVSVGYSYRSINSDYAVNSGHSELSDTSNYALDAGHSLTADTASAAHHADSADHALVADTTYTYINQFNYADTAGYAANAGHATAANIPI